MVWILGERLPFCLHLGHKLPLMCMFICFKLQAVLSLLVFRVPSDKLQWCFSAKPQSMADKRICVQRETDRGRVIVRQSKEIV